MSNLIQLLVLMAAVSAFFLTLRYLNLRDNRRPIPVKSGDLKDQELKPVINVGNSGRTLWQDGRYEQDREVVGHELHTLGASQARD